MYAEVAAAAPLSCDVRPVHGLTRLSVTVSALSWITVMCARKMSAPLLLPLISVAALHLPFTPREAASQAASGCAAALQRGSGSAKPRLQVCLHGDEIEDAAGPLPLLSLCNQLVEVLGKDARYPPQYIHLYFDDAGAERAFKRSSTAHCRSSVLTSSDDCTIHADDQILVLVAPSNRDAPRSSCEAKLECVQNLVCGAGSRPVILCNPDLQALLLSQSAGRPPEPMFLSDFEHAFFMAEAKAKIGYVTAVRRTFGSAWEVYTVASAGGVQDDEDERAVAAAAARRDGDVVDRRTTTLIEQVALSQRSERKPKAAELLVRHVRRRRATGGSSRGAVPGKPVEEPWAAEAGWKS